MTSELPWRARLSPAVLQRWEELIALRREFHRFPELSWKEERTSRRIIEWLKAQGVDEVGAMSGTGVVATIKGHQPGPTVMYRADIDALPLEEDSGVDFASTNPGVMHACGHDGHVAVGLVLASILNERRSSLRGNVKLVFQPAEELAGGAEAMIREGVMEGPQVDVVLGLHIASDLPLGVLGIRPGPVMAAIGNFQLTILGKGGHAALPHQTVDPIVVGAQVVSALQTVVSRNVEPWQTAVVTVGTFHAGTKENIIPDSAELTGSVRAFDTGLMERMFQRIEVLAGGVAQGMGAECRFHGQTECPPVVNDAAVTQRVRGHAEAIVGEAAILSPAIPASDDMAFFLQKAPGCYYLLGGADATREGQSHHQPRFAFDDRCLALGLEVALRVISEYLSEEA